MFLKKRFRHWSQKKPNKWPDLIRYTNHTTHPITTPQKSIPKIRHYSTSTRPATRRHSQPSRQTTNNLSLSSQPSSAALMAHPTPVRPLYLPLWKISPGGVCGLSLALQEGSWFLAGGNLRCFSKVRCLSEASSDFWKTLLADSRQPRSQSPTKPQRQTAHTSRASLSQPCPHQTPVL